jgi:hypothetical protein
VGSGTPSQLAAAAQSAQQPHIEWSHHSRKSTVSPASSRLAGSGPVEPRGEPLAAHLNAAQPIPTALTCVITDHTFCDLELFRATEDAGEIGGCPGQLFQRRSQQSCGAHRRKGRQQHGVLVTVLVGAQRFARAGEGSQRRPLVCVNATSSPERKCRNRVGVRQVRIAVKGGKLHNEEALDERPQGRVGRLLNHLRQAMLVSQMT